MITLKEHIKKVQNQEIDIVEYTKEVLEKCEKINKEYKCFSVITKELALKQAKKLKENPESLKDKRLAGVFISAKDCICIEGIETQSSSKILEGYKPVFDATAIKKLKDQGAIIIGKTVQDEFGFGTFCTNTGIGFENPLNPNNKERVTGGSSGGTAVISKLADFAHISLGESTGGSIVVPGSFCGVPALCPTYGRVSRYGLLDYGNSLDKIGPMGASSEDLALVLETIAGYDEKESTSVNEKVPEYEKEIKKPFSGKVGIIKEGMQEGISEEIKKRINKLVDSLEAKGIKTEEVSLPTAYNQALSIYYILAQSESSTNLAKYSGMRYGASDELHGNFNEYFSKIRGENFGPEVKRRIMIGTFVRMVGYRDAYYIKAMKARTKIIEEYKEAFKKYDILISPTSPYIAPKFSDIEKMTPLQEYMADILTVGPNLAGIPHMNVEFDKLNDMPVGLNILGDHLNETEVLRFARFIEKLDK